MQARSCEEVIEGLVAAWNAHDLEAFLSFVAEDIYWDDPAMYEPARSREQVAEFARTLFRGMPDLRYEVLDQMVTPNDDGDGGRMVLHWRMTGTQTGPITPPGMAPSLRPIRLDGLDMHERGVPALDRIGPCAWLVLDEVARQAVQAMKLRPERRYGVREIVERGDPVTQRHSLDTLSRDREERSHVARARVCE